MRLKELPDNPSEDDIDLFLADGVGGEGSASTEQIRASEVPSNPVIGELTKLGFLK